MVNPVLRDSWSRWDSTQLWTPQAEKERNRNRMRPGEAEGTQRQKGPWWPMAMLQGTNNFILQGAPRA